MSGLLRRGAACVVLACAGCSVPVAGGLDESDANRVVVALDQDGIDAVKEADPAAEGKFRVNVPRDDATRALATMADEQLPRPKSHGILEAADRGQLVPSQAAEHAQLVSGLAGELERSLGNVDGVLSARVHLNLPPRSDFRDGPPSKTSASVLVEHRGTTPPLTAEAIQRLVAGGAPDLDPANVSVVFVVHPTRPANAVTASTGLAHVGPIAVARGSMNLLRATLAGLVLFVLALASIAFALYAKLVRLRREQGEGMPMPRVVSQAPPGPHAPDGTSGAFRPSGPGAPPMQRAPGPVSMRPPAP